VRVSQRVANEEMDAVKQKASKPEKKPKVALL
jgi:predicted DNA binding CopG/RHH family protein